MLEIVLLLGLVVVAAVTPALPYLWASWSLTEARRHHWWR